MDESKTSELKQTANLAQEGRWSSYHVLCPTVEQCEGGDGYNETALFAAGQRLNNILITYIYLLLMESKESIFVCLRFRQGKNGIISH